MTGAWHFALVALAVIGGWVSLCLIGLGLILAWIEAAAHIRRRRERAEIHRDVDRIVRELDE